MSEGWTGGCGCRVQAVFVMERGVLVRIFDLRGSRYGGEGVSGQVGMSAHRFGVSGAFSCVMPGDLRVDCSWEWYPQTPSIVLKRAPLQNRIHGSDDSGTMNGKCGDKLLMAFWSAVTSSHASRSARAT